MRRTWQNPESILAVIGLAPDQTFVDIGCGDGFFTIAARPKGPPVPEWMAVLSEYGIPVTIHGGRNIRYR